MDKELLKVTQYAAGFEVRVELWKFGETSPPTEMRSAYTPTGAYIGDPSTARFLTKKGIKLMLPRPEGSIACIGYDPDKKIWYGWSHRAIRGFKKGDLLFEERFVTDDKKPFKECGDKVIETLEEAYQAACNFAAYVS